MDVVSATVSIMFIVLEQLDAATSPEEAGREIASKLSPKGKFGILRPLTEIMKHCRHDEMAGNGAECEEEASRRAYSHLRRESCTLILRLAALSVVAAHRIWETSGALAHLSKAVVEEFSDDDKSIAKHNRWVVVCLSVVPPDKRSQTELLFILVHSLGRHRNLSQCVLRWCVRQKLRRWLLESHSQGDSLHGLYRHRRTSKEG